MKWTLQGPELVLCLTSLLYTLSTWRSFTVLPVSSLTGLALVSCAPGIGSYLQMLPLPVQFHSLKKCSLNHATELSCDYHY